MNINDPIAKQTEWTPLEGGGASFGTHKLVEISTNRLEYRASNGAMLFYLLFISLGLIAVSSNFWNGLNLMVLVIGLIFTVVGGILFVSGTTPKVFDKEANAFWSGKKQGADSISLHQIHALQVVAEFIKSKKKRYHSYELNLVLKDGKRVNVIDHGDRLSFDKDAKKLSEFLNKPIWESDHK